MNALTRMVACTFSCLACVSAPLAQEVANRPELHVGDLWVFHATGEDEEGRPVDTLWHRRIEKILPDGKIQVAPLLGGADLFDASWNPIFRDFPDSPLLAFRFPLTVGATWSFGSPPGASTVDGRGYENPGSVKVVAYESITVPAGTFKCFRIEGESRWNAAIDATQPDFRRPPTTVSRIGTVPMSTILASSNTKDMSVVPS